MPQNHYEDRSDGVDEEQDPGDAGEEYIKRCDARACIDQSDTERQKDPADHVIAYACREDNNANLRLQELQFRQDSAKYGESLDLSAIGHRRIALNAYRDSHGNANKQHVCPKADRYKTLVLAELMVETVGNGTPQTKG